MCVLILVDFIQWAKNVFNILEFMNFSSHLYVIFFSLVCVTFGRGTRLQGLMII